MEVKMRRLFVLISSVLLLLSAQYTLADTEVSGDISEDTIWTTANSPYIVTGTVNVLDNVTLTIEAGVTVKFYSDTRLNVYGKLIADGLSGSVITFTSNEETKNPGDWYGIVLYSEADDSELIWCIIEYAATGLRLSECSASITDSILRYCSVNGITVYAEAEGCSGSQATPIITRCILENNTQNGIYYSGFGSSSSGCIPFSKTGFVGGTISESSINNNGGAGINIAAYDGYYANGAANPTITSNMIYSNGSGIITGGDDTVSATISENLIYGNSNSGILNESSVGEIIIRENTIYDNEGVSIYNFLSPTLESNIITEKNSYQPGNLIGYIELTDIYSTNGLAYDGDYFYTRPDDTTNGEYKIHKYDKSGNLISSFDSPKDCTSRPSLYTMAYDGSYFWVSGNQVIYKFDTDWNLIDTVPCSVSNSGGLTYDGNNLWIVQGTFDGTKIHKLDSSGNIIDSIDYSGSRLEDIAFDGTYFWCADSAAIKIYKVDINGVILDQINAPGYVSGGLEFDGTNLWVNTYNNTVPCIDKIYKIDMSGNILASFDAPGTDTAGIAYDGNSYWVADKYTAKIYQMDSNGNIVSKRDLPSPCQYYGYPQRLTFDNDHLWTATNSVEGGIINELDMEGNIIKAFDLSITDVYNFGTHIHGFGFDEGNLWLGNPNSLSPESATIEIFNTSGNSISTLVSHINPYGLAFDSEYVWILDEDTIYKLDKELNIITSFDSIVTSTTGMTFSDGFLSILKSNYDYSREIYQITTDTITPITGTILTEEDDPIENVCVEAVSLDGTNRYIGSHTNSNGQFTIIAPPLRNYYIKTDASCETTNDYGNKWWDGDDGTHNQDDAMPVLYSINPVVTPINFKLIHCNVDTDSDGIMDCYDPDDDDDGKLDEDDDFPKDPNEWLDTDGDGTGDNEDPDDDNDGMPDVWEITYGFDPLINDSRDDADGDGFSNLREYRLGTIPNDPQSYPSRRAMPWLPLLLSDE